MIAIDQTNTFSKYAPIHNLLRCEKENAETFEYSYPRDWRLSA